MNGLAVRELSEIHLVNHTGSSESEEKAAAQNKTNTLKQLALKLLIEAQSLNEVPALDVRNGVDFYEEVKRFEVDLIQRALSFTRGNQVRAARLLNMKVTTLNSKIKHYGINIDILVGGFFATEPAALSNLLREGKPRERIFHVGHVMVDNLVYQRDKLAGAEAAAFPTCALKAEFRRYGVVTLHRPSNVDDAAALRRIAFALRDISQRLPLIFPVHPRTRVNLQKFGIDLGPRVVRTPPLSYMDFLNLWKDSTAVLTDSGGLQEETTALGVPCITLRDNTERPVTVAEGTNVLAGSEPARIEQALAKVLRGDAKRGRRPALWDGRAAERIVQILQRELVSRPRARIAA